MKNKDRNLKKAKILAVTSITISIIAVLLSVFSIKVASILTKPFVLVLIAYVTGVISLANRNKGKRLAFFRNLFSAIIIPVLVILDFFNKDPNHPDDGTLNDDFFSLSDYAIALSALSLIAIILLKIFNLFK